MDLIPFNWFHAICFSPGTFISVSSTLFALVLVGRAAFVFPIANITNTNIVIGSLFYEPIYHSFWISSKV